MSRKYFTCHTDKTPYTYRCGEVIRFLIQYRENGNTVPAEQFKWKITADFGLSKEGVSDGRTGELVLEASLDRPGFIYVTVTAANKYGEPYSESDGFFGGAGVEIEKIRSVTEEPADYHAFWNACKTELLAVAPDIIEKTVLPENIEHPNHSVYDIKLTCAGGMPVSGILTVPKDEKKRPCRVIYQGYGVKSAWFDFSEEENIFCINAHGIHNREPQEYYDTLSGGKLSGYGFDKEENQNPHTCYFKYMMIRAAQALRFMMTLPQWDGQTLIARGGSQGAVQAMQAASMVPQTTLIDIFIPWLCDTQAAKIGRLCGWGEFGGNAIQYFDLSLRARYTKVKTIIEAGLGDYTSPPAGITAMYHNLQGEKQLSLVQSREHLYVSPEAETFLVEETSKNNI